jgi:hypothetical protein
MTLVEVMVTMTVLVVLMTVALVVMSLFMSVGDSISGQYAEFDQTLPALSPLQSLIRAEIEPAPPDASNVIGAPIPGFGIDTINTVNKTDTISDITSTFLVFHAYVGTTVSPNGPVLIVAGEDDVGVGDPCPASLPSTGYFCVGEYFPTAGSCPYSLSSTLKCTYGFTTTSSPTKILTEVNNVITNPETPTPNPLFSYSTFDPLATTPVTVTIPSGTEGTAFATCGAPANGDPYVNCNADAIQRVNIELTVHNPENKLKTGTSVELTSYRAQGNEIAPSLPFQYSTTVG